MKDCTCRIGSPGCPCETVAKDGICGCCRADDHNGSCWQSFRPVFRLGRMRHLDLLALWHRLHPDNHHGGSYDAAARLSKESLAALVLNSPA